MGRQARPWLRRNRRCCQLCTRNRRARHHHLARRGLTVEKTRACDEDVTADQVADAHPVVANGIKAIVDEYENSDSLEVLVAHDADKLECMIQGLEYLQQGYPAAQEWVDSTRAKLKTPSALALAEAAQTMSLAEWQRTYLR
ncbi:HD domain-containing protein [Streptomyces sp. NPDC014744]|uniref:HD domain-containing protein n=1 Tax=Streptomyces sp. NPDC014744 TaxID=3364903 RepID=UPI00370049F5